MIINHSNRAVKCEKSHLTQPTAHPPTTRRARRRLTVENSHDLHRNPYHSASNIYMAMSWAHEHHAICDRCRRRIERLNDPAYARRMVQKRMVRMQEVGEW